MSQRLLDPQCSNKSTNALENEPENALENESLSTDRETIVKDSKSKSLYTIQTRKRTLELNQISSSPVKKKHRKIEKNDKKRKRNDDEKQTTDNVIRRRKL